MKNLCNQAILRFAIEKHHIGVKGLKVLSPLPFQVMKVVGILVLEVRLSIVVRSNWLVEVILVPNGILVGIETYGSSSC